MWGSFPRAGVSLSPSGVLGVNPGKQQPEGAQRLGVVCACVCGSCACVCVYVCLWTDLCMHVCVPVCASVCGQTCACICICMHVCMCVHMCVPWGKTVHVCVPACMCVCWQIRVCACVCVHVCMRVCVCRIPSRRPAVSQGRGRVVTAQPGQRDLTDSLATRRARGQGSPAAGHQSDHSEVAGTRGSRLSLWELGLPAHSPNAVLLGHMGRGHVFLQTHGAGGGDLWWELRFCTAGVGVAGRGPLPGGGGEIASGRLGGLGCSWQAFQAPRPFRPGAGASGKRLASLCRLLGTQRVLS